MRISELSSCFGPGWRSAARVFVVFAVGAGVLAFAAPADAQRPPPTRLKVEAVRHIAPAGAAEVDLSWFYPPVVPSPTGFTVAYKLVTGNSCPERLVSFPSRVLSGAATREATIGPLNREMAACFWVRANFVGATSDWISVVDPVDFPVDLREETTPGEFPAPERPLVEAGDARITVTFAYPGRMPRVCNLYDMDNPDDLVTEGFYARWFYTRRLEGEPFGDNPSAQVEVLLLASTPGGSYPFVQNIVNGNSYVFKIRVRCAGETGPISPWSEESAVATPRGTADEITEPQGLSVVPARVEGRDTAALTVTWGHPLSGAPDRYRLQYYRGAVQDPMVMPPWSSVMLSGSSLSYDITGLAFNAEYQIRLRGEADDARPDCEVKSGRVGPCGPWAMASGNTGGANQAPVAVDDLEPIVLEVGTTRAIDVAHFFSDPDGDMLTFTAFSQNDQVVTVAVAGSTVTVTAILAGSATVSVSATDPGGALRPNRSRDYRSGAAFGGSSG